MTDGVRRIVVAAEIAFDDGELVAVLTLACGHTDRRRLGGPGSNRKVRRELRRQFRRPGTSVHCTGCAGDDIVSTTARVPCSRTTALTGGFNG